MINPGFTLPWKSKTIKTNSCLELLITNPLKKWSFPKSTIHLIYLVVFLHPSEKKTSNWSASPHISGWKSQKNLRVATTQWMVVNLRTLTGIILSQWCLKLPAFCGSAAVGNMSFRESLPSLGSHSIGPIADAPLKTDIWATPEKTHPIPRPIGSMYGIFTYIYHKKSTKCR